MIKHRYLIVGSYLFLFLAVLSFAFQDLFAGVFIAVIGIGTVISFCASPVLVWIAVKEYRTKGKSACSLTVVFLALIYFLLALSLVLLLWPQMMAV